MPVYEICLLIYNKSCAALAFRCRAECPNMTMEALNGTKCHKNGDIIIREPSTVSFMCLYELEVGNLTHYNWSLNGELLDWLTTNVVHISIPSGGPHRVTCEAFIVTPKGVNSCVNYCTCTESRTINLTVVGT